MVTDMQTQTILRMALLVSVSLVIAAGTGCAKRNATCADVTPQDQCGIDYVEYYR